MSNQFTHFASHSNNNPQITSLVSKLTLIAVVASVLLECGLGKEVVVIDRLSSKNDKILMKLTEEVNSYIQYERYLQNEKYICKAFIQNELAKNTIQRIEKLPVTLDYVKVNDLAFNQHVNGHTDSQRIFEVDRILDLLNGQCLYYDTDTFVYQYCHKEHVRQFDSEYTKLLNAKAEYEDISMGLFNVHKRNARNIKLGITEPTEEQRKIYIPQLSDFSKDYNFLTVQAIDNQYGDLQLQQSSDGNVLHSNAHLVDNDDYIQYHPIFMELHCQHQQNGDVFINYGLVVNPYILIYTNKKGKCEHLLQHKIAPKKVDYFDDESSQPIRVYGRYLYGNVQQLCTSGWSWKRNNGQGQLDNHLEEGSLLYLQFFNNHTQKIENSYTIVKRIITSQLIELQHQIGKSFSQVSHYEQTDSSTAWAARFITTVTGCNLLFKKRLNFSSPVDFSYMGNSMVKIGDDLKQGDNLGCLCKSIKKEVVRVIDLDVVIRKQLWKNHYSVFVTSNTNIFRRKQYMEKVLSKCQDYRCFPVIQQPKQPKQEEDHNRFTRIIKLSNKNTQFVFNQDDAESQYYILSIKDYGLIRLTTQKDGIIYTYLLTEGQIIKIVQYANGTKQIIKENKYYQNVTQPNSSLYHNYIYIKVNRRPNNTTFGGIWKYSDQVYFPRFHIIGEKLLRLERVKGYAYLRILNLSLMNHNLAIQKGMKGFEEHYNMAAKTAQQQEDHIFLSNSYAVNYTYTSGKYCDAPVNKHRKTIVTLKCGKAWYQISQLLQTSPCEYWIEIQTTLLCKQGFKDVVEQDQAILNRDGSDTVINYGILCHPASHFDESYPYVFMNPF